MNERFPRKLLEFTNDGRKLLMTLGERDEAGSDDKHFKRPTDIASLPEGTFFVSDGYRNTRVAKFGAPGILSQAPEMLVIFGRDVLTGDEDSPLRHGPLYSAV